MADVEAGIEKVTDNEISRFVADHNARTGKFIMINDKVRRATALIIAQLDVASKTGVTDTTLATLDKIDIDLGQTARAYLARLGTLAGTLPDPVWPTTQENALADVHEEIKRYNEAQVAELRARRELLATARGFADAQPAPAATDMTDVYVQLAKDEAAYRRDM